MKRFVMLASAMAAIFAGGAGTVQAHMTVQRLFEIERSAEMVAKQEALLSTYNFETKQDVTDDMRTGMETARVMLRCKITRACLP